MGKGMENMRAREEAERRIERERERGGREDTKLQSPSSMSGGNLILFDLMYTWPSSCASTISNPVASNPSRILISTTQ